MAISNEDLELELGYQVILPSGNTISVVGTAEALQEFVEYLQRITIIADKYTNQPDRQEITDSTHEHEWLEGLVCYRMFHADPKRLQLMCASCSSWVDVDATTFERYVARELHRQNVAEDQADREAEKMHEMVQPIFVLQEGL